MYLEKVSLNSGGFDKKSKNSMIFFPFIGHLRKNNQVVLYLNLHFLRMYHSFMM